MFRAVYKYIYAVFEADVYIRIWLWKSKRSQMACHVFSSRPWSQTKIVDQPSHDRCCLRSMHNYSFHAVYKSTFTPLTGLLLYIPTWLLRLEPKETRNNPDVFFLPTPFPHLPKAQKRISPCGWALCLVSKHGPRPCMSAPPPALRSPIPIPISLWLHNYEKECYDSPMSLRACL